MSEKELLMSLEEPLNRLHCGINAVGLMALGMLHTREPYGEGFQAVWEYLQSAEADIGKALQSNEK